MQKQGSIFKKQQIFYGHFYGAQIYQDVHAGNASYTNEEHNFHTQKI